MNFLQFASDDMLALGMCAGALFFSGAIMYFSYYVRPQAEIALQDEARLAGRLQLLRQPELAAAMNQEKAA